MPSIRPSSSALRPDQKAPEKSSLSSPFSLPARRVAHQRLEILVDVALQSSEALDVFGLFGLEGIENRLVLARGMDAALDAELGDRLDEAEARRDDADRADDRTCIGIDFIAGAGEPIAARGRDILAEDEDRDLVLRGERADAGMDQRRLHRRAARRIDRMRDGGDALPRKGALQRSARPACKVRPGRKGVPMPITPVQPDHMNDRVRHCEISRGIEAEEPVFHRVTR